MGRLGGVGWSYFGIYGLGLIELDLVWFWISPGGLDQFIKSAVELQCFSKAGEGWVRLSFAEMGIAWLGLV